MTQIVATDRALVRLLEGCDFPGVSVFSAPHEWDHGFVTRLLGDVPALLVAFVGGEAYDDTKTSTALDVAGKWSAYCVVGWHGAGQEERRLGAGAGFDLMHRAAAVLHTATLFDENGEKLSQVRVEGLGVETDSSLDISNLWVGSIALDINLPLDLDPSESCYGPLDDFIRVRGGFDIEGRQGPARDGGGRLHGRGPPGRDGPGPVSRGRKRRGRSDAWSGACGG